MPGRGMPLRLHLARAESEESEEACASVGRRVTTTMESNWHIRINAVTLDREYWYCYPRVCVLVAQADPLCYLGETAEQVERLDTEIVNTALRIS